MSTKKRAREVEDEESGRILKLPTINNSQQNLEPKQELIDDDLTPKDPEQKLIDSTTSNSGKSEQKSKATKKPIITCSLPPTCSDNPQTFGTRAQFELHYLSEHTNVCSECDKNFPTSKLLDLHITENHDPFTGIKLQKGERVFGCFVDGCDKMFRDHKKRRLHLLDKHDYPKDFVFSVVDRGIKKTDSSLIKRGKGLGVWKPA